MSNELILEILKYSGFAIAALSAIWGLTTKTSYEDEDGRKRLTQAGRVAAGLVIGSMLIAMSAFGFETVAKNLDKAEKANAAAIALAEQAQRDRRTLEDQLRTRGALEDVLRNQIRQLTTTLDAEKAQRDRDLAITRGINRAAAADLARATAAMGQMNRLLTRIDGFDFELVYRVRVEDGDSRSIEQLAGQLARYERDPSYSAATDGVRFGRLPSGRLQWVEIDQSSPLFPRPGDSLHPLVALDQAWLTISRNASEDRDQIVRDRLREEWPFGGDIFLQLGMREGRRLLRYDNRGGIQVVVILDNADRIATRTSQLASIDDLRNASLVLRLHEATRDRISLERIRVNFGGREFQFPWPRSRRTGYGEAYIVPQMRTPLF